MENPYCPLRVRFGDKTHPTLESLFAARNDWALKQLQHVLGQEPQFSERILEDVDRVLMAHRKVIETIVILQQNIIDGDDKEQS